jgi:hypothetical protein
MSDLREHLESERDRHRRARYPGDLGADLLAPRLSWKALAVQGGIFASAVAAVVLLTLRLSRAPVEIEAEPERLATMESRPGVALVFPALELPRAPDELGSIATPSLSFATPGFPTTPDNVPSRPTTKETT